MVDGTINQTTGKLTQLYYEDPLISTWKSITRMFLKNNSVSKLINELDEVIAEASDEQWFEKKWLKDKTFPKKDMDYKQRRKSVIKLNLKKSMIRKQINDNLKITEVAKQYGIIVKGKKALCPFHKDKEPSLTFWDEINAFKCFGCDAKGDIITFIKMMEDLK